MRSYLLGLGIVLLLNDLSECKNQDLFNNTLAKLKNNPNPYMTGDEEAGLGQFPGTVSLWYHHWQEFLNETYLENPYDEESEEESEIPMDRRLIKEHFCSGTIITARWVITAAVCMKINLGYDFSPDTSEDQEEGSLVLVVKAGAIHEESVDKATQVVHVSKIVVHPEYMTMQVFSQLETKMAINNLALLQVNPKFRFDNPYVQPVKLMEINPEHVDTCVFARWDFKLGMNRNYTKQLVGLLFTDVKLVSRTQCADKVNIPMLNAIQGFMCFRELTDEFSLCTGDAGSSLYYKGKLAGITSFALMNNTCITGPYKGLIGYTNVGYYASWIASVVPELEQQTPIPKSLQPACSLN